MIRNIDIAGLGFELDEDIKKYVRRKIGNLDRFVPRHARASLKVDVKLKQVDEKYGNKYECEVILHLPDSQLTAKDSTMNMFAATDIVEEKLKNLLRKYKDKHSNKSRIRGGGLLGRFKRGGPPPQPQAGSDANLGDELTPGV